MTRRTYTDRLRSAREPWGLSEAALAGLDAEQVAARLHVRAEWLRGEDDIMLYLSQMTVEEQHAEQNGPGTEGLPGYVIVGPGPWHRVGGRWAIDPDWTLHNEQGTE